MILTNLQIDALQEIMNVGVSKAATQLSILIKDELVLGVPEVKLLKADEDIENITGLEGVLAIIHQGFSGVLQGRAHLALNTAESKLLVQTLLGNVLTMEGEDVCAYEQEALTEIGNVVISSCMSTLANFLDEDIFLTVADYTEQSAHDLFAEHREVYSDVLYIKTVLTAAKHNVTGTIIVLLNLQSTTNLIKKLDQIVNQ